MEGRLRVENELIISRHENRRLREEMADILAKHNQELAKVRADKRVEVATVAQKIDAVNAEMRADPQGVVERTKSAIGPKKFEKVQTAVESMSTRSSA